MKPILYLLLTSLLMLNCDAPASKTQRYLPDSNGRINTVTVVMPEHDWQGALGTTLREKIAKPYEGLPLDEPQFTLNYMNPKVFTDFARHSRNILWFINDTLPRFELSENQFARPQLVVRFTGEDAQIQENYLLENASLINQMLVQNEQKEKRRRINKSLASNPIIKEKFDLTLTYPSAYSTFKEADNFLWMQKPIQKGHLNFVIYTLPRTALYGKVNQRILALRDSIGKAHIPGRLPDTYMSTEEAYRPYFYKTTIAGKTTYLTKGMWDVSGDYMAGPFVNYMILDEKKNRWVVLEGFAFAPSISKREYMFELSTILSGVTFGEP
ncbi:MAG: DUF4837 family protein [Flavobacteriaceae bacterium]